MDVEEFKRKVRSVDPEEWEQEASVHNVSLTRPAHDAWGIKKIIFTFCDDFLQKVLDLPYSRDEHWRRLLLPIYTAIGVDESRIVRSLLASMPPGACLSIGWQATWRKWRNF